jgi:hypothetical protein
MNSVDVCIVIEGIPCRTDGQPTSVVASTTDVVNSPCNRDHSSCNKVGVTQGLPDAEVLNKVFSICMWEV